MIAKKIDQALAKLAKNSTVSKSKAIGNVLLEEEKPPKGTKLSFHLQCSLTSNKC